ncbi:Mis6 domain-containing protein [Ophiocordyceps camponoti-floridani]|uniref:Mis6 domain-containing protein n=1 Tax=Ophiocordyceps camponoti-floridani TaxID=2030778 RepID=A0A8H4Q4Q9_9HYPO|nr:Mis6 domain-containing protein [Ophiocordyceps camponoti-floridani]
MAPTGDAATDLLVQDVIGASRIPPKSRSTSIKPTVARLATLAYEHGLSEKALEQLVDLVATPSLLDQASLTTVARNLYPKGRISPKVVLRVVSALGHGARKPSLVLQALLLRWLVMVFHVLEDRAVLTRAYPVLFNLLDSDAIRPQLAHILAFITRRKHVRPFRIQALLDLSRQTGNDPSIVGLLRVFKDYYPEIIVGEAVRGKASAFKHPDIHWRARLDEIQEAHLRHADGSSNGPRHGFRVNKPVHHRSYSFVPSVQTSQATEDSVTLEEIDSVESFVQNLEKLELPNQLVAVLADPLLQKLLVLRPGPESQRRVSNWLTSVLRDFVEGDGDEETLWSILAVVRDFVMQTKVLPPVFLDLFPQFADAWGGSGYRDVVFDLLSHAPMHDFTELYRHVFQPLESAVQDDSSATQVALLSLYTNLFDSWITTLRSADEIPPNANQMMAPLIRHVSRLALTVLQTRPGVASESAILSFYEQTVRLVSDEVLKTHIRIELPPSVLVYTLFFSSSLATVSRLCSILACYKKGFEAAMSTKARHDGSSRIDALSYDRAYVNRYNGFLMDMCNCFWRARAFSDTDTNARGCMVPRPTVTALESYVSSVERGSSLATLLSISHSPVLCLHSIRRVRELEDSAAEPPRTRHAGPVTQGSLSKLAAAGGVKLSWQEYRIDVLRSLSDKSLPGVTELLKNTMTVLKNSMEARAGAQAAAASSQSKTSS